MSHRLPTAAPSPAQGSLFDGWGDESPAVAAPASAAIPAAPLRAAPLPAAAAVARVGPGLHLAGQWVAYELRRSRRRSIGFMVGPEGLSVNAPRWVSLGEIEGVLQAKAGWIQRKLVEQRERARRVQAAQVAWGDGVGIPFLGETVIVVLDSRVSGAQLQSAAALPGVPHLTLHLGLPQAAAPEQIRDAVQSWLQRQARRVFEERCALYAPRLGVHMKRLSLSSAATRWGSANADGSIRLNWRLVHFRLPTIDYVVAHELAHLKEMNHSPAFWGVVRSLVPEYEAARSHLRDAVLPVLD